MAEKKEATVEKVEKTAKTEKTEKVEKVEKVAKTKKAEKVEAVKASFPKANAHDYEVIDCPVITEKSMALMQNANKVTVKVAASANKIEIKNAFQHIFQVKVVDVKVANVLAKTTTRGGRYKGTISGYKKAIVTIEKGAAVDLFKE